MSVRAVDELELTDKAIAALAGGTAEPPLLFDFCSSLWDDDNEPVRHQCSNRRFHADACRCACGQERR